jgi:hypothetical protein
MGVGMDEKYFWEVYTPPRRTTEYQFIGRTCILDREGVYYLYMPAQRLCICDAIRTHPLGWVLRLIKVSVTPPLYGKYHDSVFLHMGIHITVPVAADGQ